MAMHPSPIRFRTVSMMWYPNIYLHLWRITIAASAIIRITRSTNNAMIVRDSFRCVSKIVRGRGQAVLHAMIAGYAQEETRDWFRGRTVIVMACALALLFATRLHSSVIVW